MSKLSDQLRTEWLHNDTERDKELRTPEDVERFDNIQYGTDEKWNLLDVYRPAEMEGKKLPVIVIVHGGGWVYGTKEIYQFYGMNLAEHGFAVVNYNYRLAPEHKFPASFEDSASVLQWIYSNAGEYGFDLGHIFLAGDSAGGHMAGIITAIATDTEYAAFYPTVKLPKEFKPTALLMNCGAYTLFDENGNPQPETQEELMHDFLPDNQYEEDKELIDVIRHVNRDFPPAYIMTAQGDFLRRHAGLLAEKYDEYHLEYVYHIFGRKEDPLFHVFHVTIYNEDAKHCNDEECAFLKEFVR